MKLYPIPTLGIVFKRFFSNSSYIRFTSEVSSQEIPEGIWLRPLIKKEGSKFLTLCNRFKIKYFFSIYKVLKKNDNSYLHVEELIGFLSELLKSPINLSFKERLVAIAQFDPKIFNHFEDIILDIYKNHQIKDTLMCKVAEIMLTIVSVRLSEQKESFFNLAKRLVHKDQELGKIKSFSYYSKFNEILSLDSDSQRNSCISILQECCNQMNQQNSFTGTLSLATILLPMEDIENEILNFDLTRDHQDIITFNLIFRHGISWHNVCWDSQNELESKFVSLRNFFLKVYRSGKFTSFFFNKIVIRLDSSFANYFKNLDRFSLLDLLFLLIDYLSTFGSESINLPEKLLTPDLFTYQDLLHLIIKMINKEDINQDLIIFKNRFDSLPKIQSFIQHPNELSIIRLLLTLNNSPLLEEVSRLDESLNPNGSKPYDFYIQNLS